jgi:hypothetical protein
MMRAICRDNLLPPCLRSTVVLGGKKNNVKKDDEKSLDGFYVSLNICFTGVVLAADLNLWAMVGI